MAYMSKSAIESMNANAEKNLDYEKQYGEGWPWPKKEGIPGTYYRAFVDRSSDAWLLVAEGEDRIRRAVEVRGEDITRVLRDRNLPAGALVFAKEDYETILSGHPDVWVTNRPAKEWDLEVLARALWETDGDVMVWVGDRADAMDPTSRMTREVARPVTGKKLVVTSFKFAAEKVRAAFDKAWDRHEPPAPPGQDADRTSRHRFTCMARRARAWLAEHGEAEQARVHAERKKALDSISEEYYVLKVPVVIRQTK